MQIDERVRLDRLTWARFAGAIRSFDRYDAELELLADGAWSWRSLRAERALH